MRPRRGRCAGCSATHVLLPDDLLVRRRDDVAVIGSALVAHVGGEGHRSIAVRLGLPAATVRGWLRRFRSRAAVIAVFFTQWALVLSPGVDPPGPAGSAAGDAVEAIGMATRAVVIRFGPGPVWSTVARLSGGGLLANTSCLWLPAS
ncbi:MAG: helix-turn-helix domain-containing protein [Geodermatophilaceae bacterium]|nr:helix-turn-helix domain-containing protein [Geodermatophilaceae bacterium]